MGRARQIASTWLPVAIGLVLIGTLVYWRVEAGRKPKAAMAHVTMGGDTLYYSRAVTAEDATALGRALQRTGFFAGRGTTVLLARNQGVPVVSFVLNQDAWNHPDTVAGFEQMGRHIAGAVGGFPIQIHLVDTAWTVEKSLVVGKTAIGARDAIYYFGAATEDDARALGQALREAGYLADLGVSVSVWKGEGTTIGFVVQEGVWQHPDAVAGFERLVRRVAASVGGLPVQLRLLDADMQARKAVLVR